MFTALLILLAGLFMVSVGITGIAKKEDRFGISASIIGALTVTAGMIKLFQKMGII